MIVILFVFASLAFASFRLSPAQNDYESRAAITLTLLLSSIAIKFAIVDCKNMPAHQNCASLVIRPTCFLRSPRIIPPERACTHTHIRTHYLTDDAVDCVSS